MESTAVRTEKVETSNVPSRSSYRLTFWLRAPARPLMLAGGDSIAAILAAMLAMSAISAPPNPYFQAIDLVYIPLVLGCCFVVGLYDRHETDPVGRLRMRANATLGSSLVELLAIALQTPIGGVIFYMGVRAVLFFVLSFYIEYAAEGRFGRSSFGPGLIQPLHMGRRTPDWFKRAADAGVALVAGILALPFLAVSVAAIWLVDRGPAFYSQKRIGQGGRVIKVLKIRTMYGDAEQRLEQRLQEDPVARAEWERFFKLRDDPRVLGWVGRFLRRTSLDELPQIWNILCGDMSLVGPRPFPPYHLNSFDEAFRQKRQSCKPGLTGLWQVSARSNGDLEVQRALDLSYITNRSFWLDLYILFSTVPAVVKGTGAC
jgi:lipopolysaccharide/colanic/teichoic acid biosynthesis glycosyltransferase